MSAFLFSSLALVGANLAVRSAEAFWPSFVLPIATCMLMTPTLVGAGAPPWALAQQAAPNRRAGTDNAEYFKCLDSLRVFRHYHNRSECPADGEPEGLALLVERGRPAERSDRVDKRRIVREEGPIRDDRWLQELLHDHRIVGP